MFFQGKPYRLHITAEEKAELFIVHFSNQVKNFKSPKCVKK